MQQESEADKAGRTSGPRIVVWGVLALSCLCVTWWFVGKEPRASSALRGGRSATSPDLAGSVDELSWTGAGDQPMTIYAAAMETGSRLSGSRWLKLGLTLYDGKHYAEALDAFGRAEQSGDERPWPFVSLTWQGHILDLMGQRDAALACYRKVLDRYNGETMQHAQYGMLINREWIERRLSVPFERSK